MIRRSAVVLALVLGTLISAFTVQASVSTAAPSVQLRPAASMPEY